MRPTPRTLLVAASGLVLALLPALFGVQLWPVWFAFVGGLVLAMGADLLLAVPRRRMVAVLDAPAQVPVGVEARATLGLRAEGAPDGLEVEVWPTLSDRFLPVRPARVALRDGGAHAEIPLRAQRRGPGSLRRVWLRWRGPLGLVARHRVVVFDRALPVVPDLAPVRAMALRWFTPRESTVGLKVERYVGDGTEFEAMREYVRGLDARAIDWRQTARHRTLICQEHRAERNHPVVVAVDAGRLMSDPVEGVPKVDHAVTAGLVLAYAALQTGDRVGLYTFDARPRLWLAPLAGASAFPRLAHAATEIEYAEGETNFTLALAELGARLRRRTLVVLLTDFVDTISAELMVEHVLHLSRRHLVVFVALGDPAWRRMAEQAPDRATALFEGVTAAEFGAERRQVLARLARLGVTCIDATPESVSTELVNRYLDLKRREVLA